jgi:hypothetical protein
MISRAFRARGSPFRSHFHRGSIEARRSGRPRPDEVLHALGSAAASLGTAFAFRGVLRQGRRATTLEVIDAVGAAPAAEETGFRLTSPNAARAQMRVTKRNGVREVAVRGEIYLDAAF